MSTRNSRQKKAMRNQLFGGRITAPCCFCRKYLTRSTATLEHVRPLSLGGGWKLSNLRLSCSSCNFERGVEDFDAYQRKVRMHRAEHAGVK